MGKWSKVQRDQNHIEIANKLKKAKFGVVDLAAVGNSVPDLIVASPAHTVLVEVKMPKSQIYIAQLEFLAKWPGYAGFAETYEDALALVRDPETFGLSKEQRVAILEIAAEYREKSLEIKPRIRIMEFEKRLAEKLAIGE